MQPMINIALRAVRSINEQINLLLEREDLSFADPENLKRVISRVETTFYDGISRALQRAYPNHEIAKKGSLKGNPKGYSWHIMPVHNAASMVRRLPDWGFTILCKKNDQPEHALFIQPVTGDEYTATKGSGASLFDKRLRVSKTKDLSLTLVNQNLLDSLPSTDEGANLAKQYIELDQTLFGLRTSHCVPLAIAEMAAGKVDAVALKGINEAEVAAGILIAKEAGALLSDLRGNPFSERSGDLLSCNPKLLKALSPKMRNFS